MRLYPLPSDSLRPSNFSPASDRTQICINTVFRFTFHPSPFTSSLPHILTSSHPPFLTSSLPHFLTSSLPLFPSKPIRVMLNDGDLIEIFDRWRGSNLPFECNPFPGICGSNGPAALMVHQIPHHNNDTGYQYKSSKAR